MSWWRCTFGSLLQYFLHTVEHFFPHLFFPFFVLFFYFFSFQFVLSPGSLGDQSFCSCGIVLLFFLLFTTVPVVDHEGSQDLIVCCSDQLLVVSAAPCEKWSPSCLLCRGRHYKHPVQHQVFTGDVTDTNLNNFQLLRVNECTDGERQEDWGRWLYVRKYM